MKMCAIACDMLKLLQFLRLLFTYIPLSSKIDGIAKAYPSLMPSNAVFLQLWLSTHSKSISKTMAIAGVKLLLPVILSFIARLP